MEWETRYKLADDDRQRLFGESKKLREALRVAVEELKNLRTGINRELVGIERAHRMDATDANPILSRMLKETT